MNGSRGTANQEKGKDKVKPPPKNSGTIKFRVQFIHIDLLFDLLEIKHLPDSS
jgi:hypothetical protein